MTDKFDTPLTGENGFIYNFKGEKYSVEHSVDEPENFFKYYSPSKFSFDAIFKNYFFLSHPFNFNDSVDSSELFWDFKNLSEKDFRIFWSSKGYSDKYIEEIYPGEKLSGFVSTRRNFFLQETQKVGIVSLTNNPLNTLMWGHYSGETGFMIEIDKKKFLEKIFQLNRPGLNDYILYPINYVESLKTIQMPGEFPSADVPFLYSFGTKLESWSYEEEWRLVCFKNNMGVPLSKVSALKDDIPGKFERKINYPKEAIIKIILGKTFFNRDFVSKVNSTTPDKPITYYLKHSRISGFLDYLVSNYPDKIYLSGTMDIDGELKRSYEKIDIKKLNYNVYKIFRSNETKIF